MLSVIIPTCNSEEGLARTLSALVPAAAEGMIREVVVADARSSDGTETVAEAAGCHFVTTPPGWGAQVAAGAAASSRGHWLLVIPAGVLLEGEWFREAASFIERAERSGQGDAYAATFSLELDSFGWQPRLIETIIGLCGSLLGFPVREQGLLVSRRAWQRMMTRGEPKGHGDLILRIGRRRIRRLRGRAVALSPLEEGSRLKSGGAVAGHLLGALGGSMLGARR